MKKENLIPSLIQEDNIKLPYRGGNYVSLESKQKEELDKALRDLSQCNCVCNCDQRDRDHYDCNC